MKTDKFHLCENCKHSKDPGEVNALNECIGFSGITSTSTSTRFVGFTRITSTSVIEFSENPTVKKYIIDNIINCSNYEKK